MNATHESIEHPRRRPMAGLGKAAPTFVPALALACAAALTATARAEWSSTILRPDVEGVTTSRAQDGAGAQQVGWAFIDGQSHAILWGGAADQWVNLSPPDATASLVRETTGTQQVGTATIGGAEHAFIWHGTARSDDLHPAGASESEAQCTNGIQQGGSAVFDDVRRAILWSGASDQWVDLHPDGSTQSYVTGIDGDVQVGFSDSDEAPDGWYDAGLWRGTSESWTELTPGWADIAAADCASDGRQGGWATTWGRPLQAGIWSGTPGSWVGLTPGEATGHSQVTAMTGDWQAGYVTFERRRASVWRGSVESWVDLHQFLGDSYANSIATGISECDGVLYVTGVAWNTGRGEGRDGDSVAVLWTGPATGCPADLDGNGRVEFDDLLQLLADWGACP